MTLVEKEGYSQNKMENMDWLNETDQIEGKIRYILLLTPAVYPHLVLCLDFSSALRFLTKYLPIWFSYSEH